MQKIAISVMMFTGIWGTTMAGEQTAQTPRQVVAQRGGTCQTVSTCREAVELWCGGYRRADGDNDGIPCERVCRSLSEVEAIKQQIDC